MILIADLSMSESFSLPHVSSDRLRKPEEKLEKLSKLSLDFIVLLAGAIIIATFGLFQNSPAVIIGAMIIATDTSSKWFVLGYIDGGYYSFDCLSKTLVVGTFFGIAISFSMAWLLQSIALTPEIINRTHPNLLDLGMAIVAGAIGAYCQTTEKLSDTIAGVAIASATIKYYRNCACT